MSKFRILRDSKLSCERLKFPTWKLGTEYQSLKNVRNGHTVISALVSFT